LDDFEIVTNICCKPETFSFSLLRIGIKYLAHDSTPLCVSSNSVKMQTCHVLHEIHAVSAQLTL